MKLAILSRNSKLYSTRRLVEAARQRGHTVRVLDRRHVTDSGGHRTERVFIRTRIRLAGHEWEADVNLAHRTNMLFPMLLGRTALAGRFVVDPSASFVFGDPPLPGLP